MRRIRLKVFCCCGQPETDLGWLSFKRLSSNGHLLELAVDRLDEHCIQCNLITNMNENINNNSISPIGVFDSGLGGLNVLKALYAAFPQEDFIYLGDTARLPYGTKSPQTILKYLSQNIHFLLQHQVKAIIIACNSASSILDQFKEPISIPIYDVITPSINEAIQMNLQHIGLIATSATVDSKIYETRLLEKKPALLFKAKACPLLVPLVEEGWWEDPLTNLVLYRYLQPLKDSGIESLILGCTHYPSLKTGIQKIFGSSFPLIDSSICVTKALEEDLGQSLLKNPSLTKGSIQIFTTDFSPHFQKMVGYFFESISLSSIQIVNLA